MSPEYTWYACVTKCEVSNVSSIECEDQEERPVMHYHSNCDIQHSYDALMMSLN